MIIERAVGVKGFCIKKTQRVLILVTISLFVLVHVSCDSSAASVSSNKGDVDLPGVNIPPIIAKENDVPCGKDDEKQNSRNGDGMDNVLVDVRGLDAIELDGHFVEDMDSDAQMDEGALKVAFDFNHIRDELNTIIQVEGSEIDFVSNEDENSVRMIDGDNSGDETGVGLVVVSEDAIDVSNNTNTLEFSGEDYIQQQQQETLDTKAESKNSVQDANKDSDAKGTKVQNDRDQFHFETAFNYASFDCGATIMRANSEAKSSRSIIMEDLGRYMRNPCSARKWVVIELCEEILLRGVEMGNFEYFSSNPKDFMVLGSTTYPTTNWTLLGTFRARNARSDDLYVLEKPYWVRYMKFRFMTHYGNEYYCPVTIIRAYGSSMIEELKKEIHPHQTNPDWKSEHADDVTEVTNTADTKDSANNFDLPPLNIHDKNLKELESLHELNELHHKHPHDDVSAMAHTGENDSHGSLNVLKTLADQGKRIESKQMAMSQVVKKHQTVLTEAVEGINTITHNLIDAKSRIKSLESSQEATNIEFKQEVVNVKQMIGDEVFQTRRTMSEEIERLSKDLQDTKETLKITTFALIFSIAICLAISLCKITKK